MVIFQYNLYIFGIHLWTVLYPKRFYNEPCYKEVELYLTLSRIKIWSHSWQNKCGRQLTEAFQTILSYYSINVSITNIRWCSKWMNEQMNRRKEGQMEGRLQGGRERRRKEERGQIFWGKLSVTVYLSFIYFTYILISPERETRCHLPISPPPTHPPPSPNHIHTHTRWIFSFNLLLWPYKLGQGHQNLISFFVMSQLYSHENLARIQPLSSQDIVQTRQCHAHANANGIWLKTICPPTLRWRNIITLGNTRTTK